MKILEVGILNQYGQPIARRVFQNVLERDPVIFAAIFMVIQFGLQRSFENIAEELIFKKYIIHCQLVTSEDQKKFLLVYAITSKRKEIAQGVKESLQEIIEKIDVQGIFSVESTSHFSCYDHLGMIIDQVLKSSKKKGRQLHIFK